MIESMGSISAECVRKMDQLDCAMHNIANAGTTGFKATMLFYIKGGEGVNQPSEPHLTTDFTQGPIQRTGNELDTAICGKGLFVIQTKDGFGYTRDGRFTLNKEGELVTLEGNFVMGKAGRITVSGNDVRINEKGAVLVDGAEVDTLRLAAFERPDQLDKCEGGIFLDTDDQAGLHEAKDSLIVPESLELSNVNSIQEMVKLIDIHRTFESYQKMMQTLQEQDKLSTTQIGKL
ncbi:MAG: flagellar hook basal-body protein [Syntrophales bacterium]|jgi:flagellar basal body rod protein FlgG|nr:flagellar hook basal-body protein [Syntrophales bacterium]MDY0043340.1 flagellar hook basal-body protein [Syntrophales bacterium]